MKYRKKPVVIEAVRFIDCETSQKEITEFVGQEAIWSQGPDENPPLLLINTLEGKMHARPGDYIIKGIKGEFYPCKPDIFEATYDQMPNDLVQERREENL